MSAGPEAQGEPVLVTRALSVSPDPRTECAYFPALHSRPRAPGSRAALHQGAAVSSLVWVHDHCLVTQPEAKWACLRGSWRGVHRATWFPSFKVRFTQASLCYLELGGTSSDDLLQPLPHQLPCSLCVTGREREVAPGTGCRKWVVPVIHPALEEAARRFPEGIGKRVLKVWGMGKIRDFKLQEVTCTSWNFLLVLQLFFPGKRPFAQPARRWVPEACWRAP